MAASDSDLTARLAPVQKKARLIWPFVLPAALFLAAIGIGAVLLSLGWAHADAPVAFIDALFIATSCVCVTGLGTVDISTVFNTNGHLVMMVLMQLGGLGITTYGSLFLYLFTRRVFLSDRLAVGQALLQDQSFHLGRFLTRIVVVVFSIELAGMIALCLLAPDRIDVFSAAFLAISAFCNCGFALWTSNLEAFVTDIGVNTVVMLLITAGGIGFAVIDEVQRCIAAGAKKIISRLRGIPSRPVQPLSFSSRIALSTSAFLVFGGACCIFLAEYFVNTEAFFHPADVILPSLFQSVTCRTAGFNTVGIGQLTDLTLLVMIGLMFIGGSAGSCAGGIKTSGFRVLVGFCIAAVRGRSQVLVGNRAVSRSDLSKVLTLIIFSLLTLMAGIFILTLTEGGVTHVHGKTPFQVLDIAFEAVSAFATTGLTTGLTPALSVPGKLVVSALMYIGRLGPIWLITIMQKFQPEVLYRVPEGVIPIG